MRLRLSRLIWARPDHPSGQHRKPSILAISACPKNPTNSGNPLNRRRFLLRWFSPQRIGFERNSHRFVQPQQIRTSRSCLRSTCQLKASCVPFLAAINYTAASCPHAISSADRLVFRALAGGDCLTVRLPFLMLQGLYAHFLTARRIT